MKKATSIFFAILFSSVVFGQQVRDSFGVTSNSSSFNTYKELGYVFQGYVRYYISDGEVLAAGNDIQTHNIDTLRILPGFDYKKKHYYVTGIKEDGFEDSEYIKYVILPDSFKEIAPCAFYKCKSLTGFNIPKDCKTIGAASFAYTNLKSVIIPEGVKKIGGSAFNNCSRISYVELPSTLDTLGKKAFYYCDDLSIVKVHFTEPIPIEREHFFYSKPAHRIKLVVPKGSAEKFSNAEGWKIFSPIVEEE